MGYMRHHAIVLTGYDEKLVNNIHEKALIIFGGHVSPIVESPVNGYHTFLIPPDGSKEGWFDSCAGDNHRAEFIRYLEELQYEDKSSPVSWAEIQYGDDDGETRITHGKGGILNDSDAHFRNNSNN